MYRSALLATTLDCLLGGNMKSSPLCLPRQVVSLGLPTSILLCRQQFLCLSTPHRLFCLLFSVFSCSVHCRPSSVFSVMFSSQMFSSPRVVSACLESREVEELYTHRRFQTSLFYFKTPCGSKRFNMPPLLRILRSIILFELCVFSIENLLNNHTENY